MQTELLTKALAEHKTLLGKRAGNCVLCTATQVANLHALLLQMPRTAKLAGEANARFCTQLHTYANARTQKTVLLDSHGKQIPITKNALQTFARLQQTEDSAIEKESQQARISQRVCGVCKTTFAPQGKARKCEACTRLGEQSKVVRACARSAVAGQLLDFRRKHKQRVQMLMLSGFPAEAAKLDRCSLTGQPLATCKTAVDHREPFVDLWHAFCVLVGICSCGAVRTCFCDSKLRIAGRGTAKSLADTSLREQWQDYHARHAQLQMACFKANSAKGAR